VFERVRAEYVDPVSDKDLVENAINGMLTGLDPHSSNYMNAKRSATCRCRPRASSAAWASR
jgi:C-terminal processing protease CtpA/Prc